MRTLVFGDIHGGKKAVEDLLAKVKPTKTDQLIFLGDYVDGWSEAAETIDFLMELDRQFSCVFIRGNHDELCLDWLKTNKAPEMWKLHGGLATMASYKGMKTHKKEQHILFFEGLRNYYLDTQNRLFLHAGFTNVKGVQYEHFQKMFYWDRTLWELALAIDKNMEVNHARYPKRLLHYKEIFIGHTPVTRIGKTKPVQAANVWNIDTGAAFKGPLSCMDVDSKVVWQSDAVFQFYPKEKGRN